MEETEKITEKEVKLSDNPLQFLEKDSEELINKISELVEKVKSYNSAAMVELGYFYMEGKYFKKNEKKAVELFEKAAEKDNLDAIVGLWLCYEGGFGVEKNKERADIYFKLAVNKCDADFLDDLIKLYEEIEFVEKNIIKTTKLYEKAFYFGNSYLHGINGVKRNLEEGIKLLEMAAENGNHKAMFELGYCYQLDGSVEQDPEKATEFYNMAIKFYKIATKYNNSEAMVRLGYCYQYGYGVKKSLKKTTKLYEQAVSLGNEEAKIRLEMIQHKEETTKNEITDKQFEYSEGKKPISFESSTTTDTDGVKNKRFENLVDQQQKGKQEDKQNRGINGK